MSQPIEKNRKYTYGDIECYPENERWEIIDGIPYLQAQPSITHQRCSFELSRQFGNFLKDKPCEVIPEPAVFLDLKAGEKCKTSSKYVVPDLVINCDIKNKETFKLELQLRDRKCTRMYFYYLEKIKRKFLTRYQKTRKSYWNYSISLYQLKYSYNFSGF